MRLQKYLAQAGVASRRKSEELIREGHIRVNGELVTDMGYVVEEGDEVLYKGEPVSEEEEKVYLAFHKPREVLSTVSDDRGRKTVIDYYHGPYRIYPIGRLDYYSEGLLLLTNDGDFALRLSHPRYDKEKVYLVWTNRPISAEEKKILQEGVEIDGYKTRPITIRERKNCYEFTLHEGRNRQIRKILDHVDIKVRKLLRVRIGNVKLGSLQVGEMRALRKDEIHGD